MNAKQKRIGLALGGGGARGLAHIIVLETLDEMGIRPHRIAGTSIGAVMGALYASGKSGDNIRRSVMQFLAAKRQRGSASNFLHAGITHWIDHIHPGFGSDRLLDTGDFLSFLHEEIQVGAFEELIIPLSVVTTDIWRHEPVVFDTAALFPALRASIAFPGLFRPLLYQERSLVDGGLVNPVPYDILAADCDISIAVDVSERWSKVPKSPPQFFDNIFNSFQAMSKTIIAEKLKNHAPDIYLKPDMVDIHLLDFGKAKTIFSQAAPIKDVLKRSLSELLK